MPDITYTSPLSKVSYTWTPKNPDYVPTEDDYRDFAAEIDQRETGTEQSAVGAMASSAAQGLTSIPGTVAQGVGALTGLTDLEQSGKYFAQKARELTPIDPMRRNDLSVELAGAAGQAVGQLGLALATGGGSLGTSVLLGSAAAMGAASGAESAEARGLEGARRYGEILGYAGTEVITERLFGLGSKTFFKPAAEAGGKVAKTAKTILGEAAEESLAGFGTNVVSNLTAVGLDIPNPDIFTAEAFKSYARQGLAGAVGGTVFAGAQLAMGKQATQESITRKFATVDGERREVSNFTDEELAAAGVDPSTIEQQTFVSPIDAEAINSVTPGARTILEGVFGNELEVPIGKPTVEQEQTFDEIIAANAARKAAATSGVPTPAATEAAVLPTEEPAPSETTVPPPVAGAPIVPPTTPPPDATTEGIIPENGFQERVQTDEGGAPPEAGGGNRSFTSGQVEQIRGQEQAVTPPLPSEATPTETGSLPQPMTGVSGGVAAAPVAAAPAPKPDPRDKIYAELLAKGTPVGENLVELTEKQVSPALRKKLQSDRDTAAGYVSRPQETESFYFRFKGDVTGNPSDRGWILKDKRPDFARRFAPAAQTPAAAPATIGVADLATGPLTRVTARKNVDPKRVVSGNRPKGIPPNAVETPQGNVEFVTPEMAPGIPQPARRKPLNDAVVKETVRKVFGTIPSNLSFINIDRQVDGMASVKAQTIDVNLRYIPNAKRLEEVLRHEATHLIYQDPLVQADLELLRQEIPADLAAEVDRLYSDPEFTESIRKEEAVVRLVERLKGSPKSQNAWERFVESVRVAFRKLFGRSPTPRELNQAANRILERAVANVAVQRTDAQPDSMGDASDVRLAFAGEQSIKNLSGERRKFMADSLDAAKAMAAAGKSREEIRAVTGWFPGFGKGNEKLRWEIPDNSAAINKEYLKEFAKGDRVSITLGRFLDHPALYEAYPQALDLIVEYDEFLRSEGAYQSGIIYFGPNTTRVESILLHEIQHWIQDKEGFAKGGDPLMAFADPRMGIGSKEGYRAAKKILNRILGDMEKPLSIEKFSKDAWQSDVVTPEIKESYTDYLATMRKGSSKYDLQKLAQETAAKEWYKNLAGEIEARDVQARQNLTPEQRKATAPYSSENIAEKDAIVMFRSGGPQASMSMPSPESVRHSELKAKFKAGTITPEEQTEADNLVKDKARAAGYNSRQFHDTNGEFFIFDLARGSGIAGVGAYTTNKPFSSDKYGVRRLNLYSKADAVADFTIGDSAISDMAEKFGLPRITQLRGIPELKEWSGKFKRRMLRAGYDAADIMGEDGAIYRVHYKSSSQLKSADTFTDVDLDDRFDVKKDDIRYSMTPEAQRIDQEYMTAVEAGDMETAQRIVDEAAKAAGNNSGALYHSRLSPRNKFNKYGKFMGVSGVSGIHLTDSKEMAQRYLDRFDNFGYIDGKPNQPFTKEVIRLYAKIEKPLYRQERFSTNIKFGFPIPSDYVSPVEKLGYDALIRDEAISKGGPVKHSDAKNAIRGKEIILFDPTRLKSADPITRDDAGKIILPSQRFDSEKSDIRYSMTPVDDSDVLGYTTQVFGEKMSVAEVESIKEIYESIRKTLFDYTQPVTDASLQEFYLLYNSVRPTESGKADILWLKDFGTQTAYPGAVFGALFAFSDKIPDGGQAQREIIELIERSRIDPKQSFSDFWTSDSSTGTVTEGGRALGARSFIVNYLNKLRGVLSHRALRIEAASKETNLPAADIKAIDVSTNGQANEGMVAEELDKKKTRGGKSVVDEIAKTAQPESETDPRNKPENSPATDPKTSSELAAKRLISKYNTNKTKKIEKKEADVVTVLFKEHLSLKGGQSSADLKQKLIDAGLSPATAAELTATAENELNRLLQAERDRDSKPMKGADALLASDKSARAIVNKLAVSQSDTWSWPDPANKDPVVALVARYYKGNMTNEQLNLELEKLKVEKGLRAVLVNAVSAELSKKKSVAQAKEADVEKDALAIINKLSQTQSDTLSWPIEKPTSPIVELVTRFYDANGSMSAQALDAELIKLGLPTRSRIILVNSVSAELSKRQAVKAAREKLIADNKPTKSAESFAANWQKSQDAPKDPKDTEKDPVRSILNQLSKVGRGEFHFDLSPDGKALFFDIVYKKLLGLNVSEKAAMAATSAAYQKYLTNRANQIAALRKTVAEKGLSKALAREMMNITATNQRDPEFAKKFIKQVLLDAGIPEDIADASLPLLLPSFQKALADTREKLLRDFIDGRPKGAKRIPKPVVDEFLKAVRLGATNPDYEPSTPFAKANKWRNFTRAEHDEMARLDEIAMDPMQTRQEQQIALAGIAKIVSSKITEYDKLVVAAEIYRNSALSNFLTTGGIQVYTPLFSAAARVLTDGVVGLVKEGNFNRFIASVESFMRAASPAALKSELFSAFGQNITTFNKAYELDNQAQLNELSNLYRILDNSIKTWKTTKNPVAKAKALIGITYGSMDYVRRAYASLDNVSQSVFYRQIMDLGVRDIILKANGTDADFRNMISNRTRRHEQIVTELISQGQSPSRAWVNASEISRREMAGEIVDIYGKEVGAQVEAQDVISRKETAREIGVASDAELDGHVIPMLIETIKALSKASDNRMAGSGALTSLILFGFPVTALKVMNRSLDYSIVGLFRAMASASETKKYANDPEYKSKYPSYKTDNQRHQRMAETAVGTIGMIALLAMVMGERDKEPEDRLFMVHNAGPRDRAARQIWRAAGNEPQSVQFRFGTNSPWLGISWAKAGLEVFAPIFAVAGATFDSTDPTIRREDAYDQVMVFASQSLASMSRPLSSIQDTAGVLSGKEMSLSSRSLANQIGFRASSFLPWSSLTRNYNKWQGARDTSNALSAFAAMIPIVGPSLTEPALNSLGDPIGKTPNEYSYKLGTAIPVSFGLRREDTPLYEFLLSKGKFPTAISRPTQEKKYGKMSDETWRKYIEVRGQNLKSLIIKRKDSLDKLNAERYDDAIENLTGIANDRARATLKMRPAPK